MLVYGILWDVNDSNELSLLPDHMFIPDDIIDDLVDDYISDITGFCHKGFSCLYDCSLNENILNTYELEDDGTPDGGTSHLGESLLEFIHSTGMDIPTSFDENWLVMMNSELSSCGLLPININVLGELICDYYIDNNIIVDEIELF